MSTPEVLAGVLAERRRQDAVFGLDDHPDVPLIPGDPHNAANELEAAYTLGIPTARDARIARNEAGSEEVTWGHVLVEEVAEAVEAGATGDTRALRKELLQVAATAVAWIEAIDRRNTIAKDAVSVDARPRVGPERVVDLLASLQHRVAPALDAMAHLLPPTYTITTLLSDFAAHTRDLVDRVTGTLGFTADDLPSMDRVFLRRALATAGWSLEDASEAVARHCGVPVNVLDASNTTIAAYTALVQIECGGPLPDGWTSENGADLVRLVLSLANTRKACTRGLPSLLRKQG